LLPTLTGTPDNTWADEDRVVLTLLGELALGAAETGVAL
jgi:hypothetical protein